MGWFSKKKSRLPKQKKGDKKLASPFEILKSSLEKTRTKISSKFKNIVSFRKKINTDVLDELEEILLESDVGVGPTTRMVQEIRDAWQAKEIENTSEVYEFLKDRLKQALKEWDVSLKVPTVSPIVIMVAGINGAGKTTSIAKIANIFIKQGKSVMLSASDTFRAAAVEQLDIWSKRIGSDIVKHQTGADPAAVTFDALEACLKRKTDVLIVDTAGRLHTHDNLMKELSKIKRVISSKIENAPHEVLMVLDATTGQNAISQMKLFKDAVGITGIVLSKLDGTAKGGVILGMRDEIDIPVKFIGIGEGVEDIQVFDGDAFVDALFDG
ncbi:MAG: signal recognition particle-docking protein FtsY [Candidatus Scalindua sp. AMX11]|nr:MAG: signal recognition particle-docking protein FtsY [Candidatus Scalindua sp.]NOG84826.1 signal recognition particle-docking protein FtsY [Planctomycetota bacterium]RZV98425.1 MAG: signal recognition particle-docking protein FtsY [Candidatus Scalindua sp. SCAELEC01]TDE66479.1 MAG: signal recognition particle-docking protein FtsY [Candidatus Scalindua sp. AMX11]GJQ58844.1 MAG: signal recognition particle-docking protein FtsY [Candidatus Scalindua sp.]